MRVLKSHESFDIVEKSSGRCGARTMQNPPARTYVAVPHLHFAQEESRLTPLPANPNDPLAAVHNLCSPVLKWAALTQVIQRGAAARRSQPCPFCGEDPLLAAPFAGRFIVGCENDACAANPQVSAQSLHDAWTRWNKRP